MDLRTTEIVYKNRIYTKWNILFGFRVDRFEWRYSNEGLTIYKTKLLTFNMILIMDKQNGYFVSIVLSSSVDKFLNR